MSDEIKRLQVALAYTEKQWRNERANSKMFKELYLKSKGEAVDWCPQCPTLKRWFCLRACPPVQAQHEKW